MRHLTRELRTIGSKAGATAVAATLAVGGVAAAQTGEATPEPPAAETVDEDAEVDTDDDGTEEDDGTGGEARVDLPVDGDADDAEVADGEPDDGDEVDDDDEVDEDGDEVDDAPGAGADARDDEGEDRPGRSRGREQRGSATSERVHEALTLDGVLRPGDEGWGAAVSESARAGGHGQRVSRAARGEAAPAPAARTAERGDAAGPPTGAPGRSGQAPGRTRGDR